MDYWTQRTNLYLGKIRIHIVCQKLQTLWTTGRNGQTYNQGTLESISVCQKLQTLWTTGCSGQICNKGRSDPYQCVKINGHCGQLDTADKSVTREYQNPYQCVKNWGHCGQFLIVPTPYLWRHSVLDCGLLLCSLGCMVDFPITQQVAIILGP